MANPQNTPSDQDLNVTGNNPNVGNVADDMDAGAPVPRPDRMGGTPMRSADEMDMGATEPMAYDEETDILIETPAEGAEAANVQRAENEGMTPNAMNYAGDTVPEDTESAYTATPDTREGLPQGSSPSNTGVEGAGSREPGGEGFDTANSGLAGAENSPSNSGVEGQGVTEDGGTVPRNA
ncbi:MAG TPA: hypothetical protein VF116_01900 [Ktedonobacterales bacterium]